MSAPKSEPAFVSAQAVADFYRRDGFQVLKTKSCWWYNQYRQSWYFVQFPLHRLIRPEPQELDEVFRQFPRALAVRFVSPRGDAGYPGAMWVQRAPFTLQDLKPKVRNHTRLGLKLCRIERMTFDRLVPLARQAHDDTTVRHGKKISATLGLNTALDSCNGYEAWGAFVGENLAAFMVTLTVEDWTHILVSRSVDQFLKYYPNNALIARILEEKFSQHDITAINYGWKSLTEPESLQRFKLSMGFVQESITQRIALRPWLRPLVNPVTGKILGSISRRSNSASFRRLYGIVQIAAMSA